MFRNAVILIILATTLVATGCVYQAPLSQGNLLEDKDLDQVEVGMTRGQVRFLLGTPMVDDPFNRDRWDYLYYLRVGRDKALFKRWVAVYFDEDDKVARIEKERILNPDI